MKLPEFGVKRPTATTMIFLGLFLIGIISLAKLPIDMTPEVNPPSISAITIYPGASAEDVEKQVSKVIENDLSIVSDLDEITSVSKEGLSIVSCKFEWGSNLNNAADNIRERLEFSKRKLPDGALDPILYKFSTSAIPIAGYGVSANENWNNLYDIVDNNIAAPLKRIKGVGAVQIIGGLKRQINVKLDRVKMQALSVSLTEIERAIKGSNVTFPAGSIKLGEREYFIRVPGEFTSVNEIGNVVIKQNRGNIIYVRDVAVIEDGFEEHARRVSIDGNKGILIMIQKQSNANTVEVVSKVTEKLNKIKNKLPTDVKLSKMFDTASFIKQALDNLKSSVIWSCVFVVLVTFMFLRRINSSIVVVMTIPFSIISGFIIMYLAGYTINMMTLSSLAIAMGMVVDNAVVVLENIMSFIEKGENLEHSSIEGSSQVGLAIMASTFTTVVIFVPLLFLSGITGIMFSQLGAVISVTLISSLLISLTFTPMLTSKLLKKIVKYFQERKNNLSAKKSIYDKTEGVFVELDKAYASIVEWALIHKLMIIIASIIIFVISISLAKKVGFEFLPAEDTGDLRFTFSLPVGTTVDKSEVVAKQIEKLLLNKYKQVDNGGIILHFFTRVGQTQGSSVSSGMKEGPNIGIVGAKLCSQNERNISGTEVAHVIEKEIRKIPGIEKLQVDVGNPINSMMFSGKKDIAVAIIGEDLKATNELALTFKKLMESVRGTSNVVITRDIGKPEIEINVNKDKATSLGFNMFSIGMQLRTLIYGRDVSEFAEFGNEYDINIRLDQSDRNKIEFLEQMPISAPNGSIIQLGNIANITQRYGPIEIERKNQERVVYIECDIYNRPLGDVAGDIMKKAKKLSLPNGVEVDYGGMIKEQKKSMKEMMILFTIGILLVFMVMAAQFESLIQPFIIMFSLPFAFVGVICALYWTNNTFNLISLIGSIMLVGVVVNNAIVLVDRVNQLIAEGKSKYDALVIGGRQRLRPILITSFTTIFGMLPLALSTGEGSEMWKPLAIVVIGGLLLSMIVSLVLVPVMYSILVKNK